MIFPFFNKIGFLGILGQPGNHASQWIRDLWSKGVYYYGIGATIRIGREMLCLPFARFLNTVSRCFVLKQILLVQGFIQNIRDIVKMQQQLQQKYMYILHDKE